MLRGQECLAPEFGFSSGSAVAASSDATQMRPCSGAAHRVGIGSSLTAWSGSWPRFIRCQVGFESMRALRWPEFSLPIGRLAAIFSRFVKRSPAGLVRRQEIRHLRSS